MKFLYLFCLVLLIPFSSCNPAEDQGGCASDSECRYGRQCVQGFCAGDVDPNASNNSSQNNKTNNNKTNNNVATNNVSTNNGTINNIYTTSTNNSIPPNNRNNSSNNQTAEFCITKQDCRSDQSCSNDRHGDDIDLHCYDAENAEVRDAEISESGCFIEWEIEGGRYASYKCKRLNLENYRCVCNSPSHPRGASFDLGGRKLACEDFVGIEERVNAYCATRFRGTFFEIQE